MSLPARTPVRIACVEVDDVGRAAGAGVPFIEIVDVGAELRTFFDYVKQRQQ